MTEEVGLFDPQKVAMLLGKVLRLKEAPRMSTTDNLAFVQILSTHLFHAQFVSKGVSVAA